MEYGLIGEKLGHSYSKLIQEKLIENYTFEIHPIAKENLDAFMKEKSFKGINVTIPYKQNVIPYLDTLDAASKKIGAVNTIVNKDGKLTGHNTDYYGFKYMLDHHNIDITNKKVLVMGNGGASKAIQAVLQDGNASQMLIVDLVLNEGVITLEEVYEKHLDVDVIVNTTPLGMYPKVEASCVDVSLFTKAFACVDVVYNPFHTSFTLQAKQLGLIAVSGLEMLVAQAKYALEYFKDIQIDDCEIDRIYKEILLETLNYVITSDTISQDTLNEVSTLLQKEVIDIRNASMDEIKTACIKNNVILVCSKETNNNEVLYNLTRNGIFSIGNTAKLLAENFVEQVKSI